NSLFTDGSADAFQCYFKPVSAAGFAQLSAIDGATFFPAKFSAADLRGPAQTKSGARVPGLSYLHRPEAIAISDFFIGVIHLLPWIPTQHELCGLPIDAVYRLLAAKYLRPREAVMNEVEAFHRDHIAGRPTVAVHVRGLDKGGEAGPM